MNKIIITIILLFLSTTIFASDFLKIHTEVLDSSFVNIWAIEQVDSGLYLTEKEGKLWFLSNTSEKTLIDHRITSSSYQGGRFDIIVRGNILYSNWIDIFDRHRLAVYYINSYNNLTLLKLITLKENVGNHNIGGRMIWYQDQLIISTGDTLLSINEYEDVPEVYATGFKNCQGLAVRNGLLYASSHGSGTTDRLDIVIKGNNYSDLPTISDRYIAPSGNDFLNDNILLQSSLKKRAVYFINLESEFAYKVVKDYGRSRDVSVKDEYTFFTSTTNNDWFSLPTDPERDYVLQHIIKRLVIINTVFDTYVQVDYYNEDSLHIGTEMCYVENDTMYAGLRGKYCIISHYNHLDLVLEITTNDVYNTGEMYSGDFNQDGVITVTDFNLFWYYLSNGEYNLIVDANFDGVLSVADYNEFYLNLSKIGHPLIRK